jgi:hypothetical protein
MSINDREDDLLATLSAVLPVHDVARPRAERIRARCHARLARPGWQQAVATFVAGPFYRRILEPALVGGLGVVYLTEVVQRALSLYGL